MEDSNLSENIQLKVCRVCGTPLNEGQVFCTNCGATTNILKKTICTNCGAEIQDGQSFCQKCGQKVGLNVEPNVNSAINQFNNNINKNKEKSNRKIGIIATCAIVAVIAIVLIVKSGNKVNLRKVYEKVGGDGYYCTIASDNSYIKVDTNPLDLDDYSATSAWSTVKRLNEELGFSSSLNEKMNHTRALDGRLTETNGKVKVSWTYHPDKGLEVMYELEK